MKHIVMVFLCLLLAGTAADGKERPMLASGPHDILFGGEAGAAKAVRDTTYLLGGPGSLDGKFQDQFGNADWQGWTHIDLTAPPAVTNWHVDTFNVPAGGGAYAIWCGQRDYPNACGDGYGNNWADNLVFTYTVPNPSVDTTVRLECIYNSDSEPGYDFFRIQQNRGGTWEDLANLDGVHFGEAFDQTVTFAPEDYAGPSGTQVQLRFQGASDVGWSDEDCLYDSEGLAQVDNIRVTIGDNVWYEDHEDGDNDHWVWQPATGVGDFAKIWLDLQDIDLCVSNSSPQVAFIDDGIVVPGTGGTSCITWCYGPGGYIVNNTGGLLGPAAHIDNLVISPVLNCPEGNEGAVLSFSVYAHETMTAGVSPGIQFQFRLRSAVDPADLADAPWQDTAVFSGLGYMRGDFAVTSLLTPGRTVVQIGLRCVEYGWLWGIDGVDGTPAPYFDDIAFKVFPINAPSILTGGYYLAQDSFPERGDIDLANLANNWVRFDVATDLASGSPTVDPGDSIIAYLILSRAGSVLNDLPKMFVKMKANPLFDAVRVLPANFMQSGDLIDGWVYGDSTFNPNGTVVQDCYNFDLPDSTFFFPGDVIHYYIEAQDNLNGDIGTATLPADISDVGDFDGLFPYGGNYAFIVRALPTLFDIAGNQPRILFWEDSQYFGHREWTFALNNLGYNEQVDYDLYFTGIASSNQSNGLGGRATSQTIGGYDVLLYNSGFISREVLEDRDIAVLGNWFQQGGKKAFMTGDDLVFSLANSGSEALNFLNTYLSVHLVSDNIMPLINNQTSPTVVPVAGNSVFTTPAAWIVFGGCPGVNDFDAIEPWGSAERLAQFLTPSGAPGYTYAAAQRYTDFADVISMPNDFSLISIPDGYVPSHPGYSARTEVLRDILITFGHLPGGEVIDVPGGDVVFGVTSSPNPFNPATEIRMTLPHAGHVSLKIFNLRGELVRTLVDGGLEAGVQKVTWHGTDDAGRQVASGVYFSEAKYDNKTSISKLALVK